MIATAPIPVGVGRVDNHGNVPNLSVSLFRGKKLSVWLPPRTVVVDLSKCTWLKNPRVQGHLSWHWNHQHDTKVYGNVTFNGAEFVNYSYRRAVNVYAQTFKGC